MFGRKASQKPADSTVVNNAENNVGSAGNYSENIGFTVAAASLTVASEGKRCQEPSATSQLLQQTNQIRSQVLADIDPSVALSMESSQLQQKIAVMIDELASQQRILLTHEQQNQLASNMVDDMRGIGPIQALLDDPSVTDIMVNGHQQIYVERHGKLQATDYRFRDEQHLRHVARRIASQVGRRVDESSPMVDARLPDGSRVNVVIPPLALDGTCISIRKFNQNKLTLQGLVETHSLSAEMAELLSIAAKCRLNILVAGGTGAGKTTLLNALSCEISDRERLVTIEDAAELQLQQPHVIRLETRPNNIEGQGEVTQRELLKNALRMRPDRIILGEVRGAEAFDMLQAMNTGHDGSMSTLHANSSQDALIRLENMLSMAEMQMSGQAMRQQLSSAVNIIVQIARMRDGTRRVVQIDEISGMEQGQIQLQPLFQYQLAQQSQQAGDAHSLNGEFVCCGPLPRFLDQASYYGLDQSLRSLFKNIRRAP